MNLNLRYCPYLEMLKIMQIPLVVFQMLVRHILACQKHLSVPTTLNNTSRQS